MTGSPKSDYNSSTSSFPSPSKPRQSTLIWPQLPPLACRIQHFSACPAGPLEKIILASCSVRLPQICTALSET